MSERLVDKMKAKILPTAVSIIVMFIWSDITELKSDVKELLAQSNIDKTKIENLERIIYQKQNLKAQATVYPSIDKYFKHEELFDIKKYIAKN